MDARDWLRWIVFATTAFPVVVTGLSLVRHPHWAFRIWDFPRVQIAVVALAGLAVYGIVFFESGPADLALVSLAAATIAWQLFRIHRYTPLTRPTVMRATRVDEANRISLLMSNVLMENDQHGQLVDLIRDVQPDVVLAVEVDDRWMRGLETLTRDYPHVVRLPQGNWYGMLLLSRLELIDTTVEFLVQDDIPSIHTRVRLRSGVEVTLHGLHPRPPEPVRDQRSTPRDAELVVVGRAIGEEKDVPTIVVGDLNDVAWSSTSELFVRLSGLLDPRAGRGFFNSYNAKSALFRYPLDHIFHSTHFKLVEIRRLRSIGSDHFPMFIVLQYEPEAELQQEESEKRPGDEELADEKIEKQSEDAAEGKDRPRE